MDFPVILHILSYDHDQLHRLVSKTLAKYADGDGDGQQSYTNKPLPISLLLNKSNRFRDYAAVLFSSPSKRKVCELAAHHGNLTALQWARNPNSFAASTEDSSPSKSIMIPTTHTSQLPFYWDTDTCYGAAENGHVQVLQWARSQGCPWDTYTCSSAAEMGNLEVLQCARSWDTRTCSRAAGNGHLQWARCQGCPWDFLSCSFAAHCGQLEVLQWARGQGCPWDTNTCSKAALNGHLEVLQWTRSQGCPWDTCSYAALNGHLEVLQWARSQGCPWNSDTCSEAARNGHVAVLQWARSRDRISYHAAR